MKTASLRVLIIEDNHDIVANLYAFLEPLSYELDCAFNGALGLELARQNTFDVIVLGHHVARYGWPACLFDAPYNLRVQKSVGKCLSVYGSRFHCRQPHLKPIYCRRHGSVHSARCPNTHL